MDITDYVGAPPSSNRLGDLDRYVLEAKVVAPLDEFRKSISTMIRYGSPERLADASFIGRLLLLGVVSAAEAYFRAVLSACVSLCPVCQSIAAKKNINLGGLLWHGHSNYSRSAFEHYSFTSRDELKKICEGFLGFKLEDAKFKDPLQQFDAVCQLRHGIVHAGGLLPGVNAVQLDIRRYSSPVRIQIGYDQIQEVAGVVDTLVVTFNRELFAEMCKRWAVDWRKRADWVPDQEARLFGEIWKIFFSSEQNKNRKGRSKFRKKTCYDKVRQHFNII